MKMLDIEKLKPKDKTPHKHWGKCSIVKIEHTILGDFFGITIKPTTKEGKTKLALWSGTNISHVMEGNIKLIKNLEREI